LCGRRAAAGGDDRQQQGKYQERDKHLARIPARSLHTTFSFSLMANEIPVTPTRPVSACNSVLWHLLSWFFSCYSNPIGFMKWERDFLEGCAPKSPLALTRVHNQLRIAIGLTQMVRFFALLVIFRPAGRKRTYTFHHMPDTDQRVHAPKAPYVSSLPHDEMLF
jgi:hypothetical protein